MGHEPRRQPLCFARWLFSNLVLATQRLKAILKALLVVVRQDEGVVLATDGMDRILECELERQPRKRFLRRARRLRHLGYAKKESFDILTGRHRVVSA